MNVLLVEDRGSAAFYVVQWLQVNGHRVLEAFNPNDAQTFWKNRGSEPIDCIILDLSMPTDGLNEDQVLRSKGGLLSGWVWLYDRVLPEAPEMKQRIIIYSDYVQDLKDSVPEDDYRGLTLISKRQRSSSAEQVAACIEQIARMAQ